MREREREISGEGDVPHGPPGYVVSYWDINSKLIKILIKYYGTFSVSILQFAVFIDFYYLYTLNNG